MSGRGRLVTFEGGEGSGKSTQAAALAARLEAAARPAVRLREPGGTPLGETLRDLILHSGPEITPEAEFLLFLAARAELVRLQLRPALDAGQVVICDRFSDSTLAYQGYGRGLDLAAIRPLDAFATGGLVPDLTLLLDLPLEAGLARRTGGADAIERQEAAFHERVRQSYLALAAAAPERWLVLDGTDSVAAIEARVWARVEALLS